MTSALCTYFLSPSKSGLASAPRVPHDIKGAIRRNAMQVDDILHGAKPSEMPYVQETRFELVINLLGLENPLGWSPAPTR